MNDKFNTGSFSIIPRDILQNEPIFHLVGKGRLHIENHQGIIEFTDNYIRISTRCGIMYINGDNLMIREIDVCSIIVFGDISNIGYKE